MREGLRRAGAVAVASVALAPLLALPLRAAADVWRAPALLPQAWGTRGLDAVLAPGTRVGQAIGLSISVALVSTIVSLALGWPVARAIATVTGRRRTALFAVMVLPLLVPPYAAGFGLTRWLLSVGISDGLPALLAAHVVYVLPYTTLTLTAAFTPELRELEEAAEAAGAGRWSRLRLVTVPAAAATTAAAGLLGFIVSWSQYGTSLAAGGGRLTLPVVLLPFVESDPQIASMLALVFLIPPLVVLVGVGRLIGTTDAAEHHAAVGKDSPMMARTSSNGG